MSYICKCKKEKFFDKNYSYWEDRNVTSDELDVIDFILNSDDGQYHSILHIGIGNSHFAKTINNSYSVTGITISKKEIDKAESMSLSNYDFFFI